LEASVEAAEVMDLPAQEAVTELAAAVARRRVAGRRAAREVERAAKVARAAERRAVASWTTLARDSRSSRSAQCQSNQSFYFYSFYLVI
jgi:hypothetical protein